MKTLAAEVGEAEDTIEEVFEPHLLRCGFLQRTSRGRTITDDKSLVQTLVDSDSLKFNACRLAFKFLYGRDENKCEGPLFDQCIDAFTAGGTIQSAVATIAKDASFCQ